MKPRGGTGTFDGLNFAAANFETRGSVATNTTAAAIKEEEEESKERRADKRNKRSHQPAAHKHIAPAHTAANTQRPLTPTHTHPPQLRIDLFPSIAATGSGGTAGAEGVSVSHVSKNGVSFFPHFSFNDEGKEGGEEEGEEVSGRMEGEGETDREDEKSRVSSTEMDDDISIRYTTPTMASNHIVRPLPSPSSLSVPQPSIGSGIGSSVEHSVVGSVAMPYKGRMGPGREGSAFFPSVFSPKNSVNSGASADMYGEDGIGSSPLSGHPSSAAAAASPPSTSSPLSHTVNPLPVFSRPHDAAPQLPRHLSHPSMSVSAASVLSSSSLYHPTTTIVSPPPPPGDHLILNTHAIALASQLFDDSELSSHTATSSQHAASLQKQQRSPRHSMQRVGSMPGGLRAPMAASASSATAGSPPTSSPHASEAPAVSPGGMYRHSSQPVADRLSRTQHSSLVDVHLHFCLHATPFRPPPTTTSFPEPSRTLARPHSSLAVRLVPCTRRPTPCPALELKAADSAALLRRAGPAVRGGRVGGDGRISDGLYSVSRGSDVDEDGSVTLEWQRWRSGGCGGGGRVELVSRVESGRSREESRLKTLSAMTS